MSNTGAVGVSSELVVLKIVVPKIRVRTRQTAREGGAEFGKGGVGVARSRRLAVAGGAGARGARVEVGVGHRGGWAGAGDGGEQRRVVSLKREHGFDVRRRR